MSITSPPPTFIKIQLHIMNGSSSNTAMTQGFWCSFAGPLRVCSLVKSPGSGQEKKLNCLLSPRRKSVELDSFSLKMVPLIVKDYTWRQTKETVYVTLTVNGIKAAKSSFITADNYIRLHCHPYYFEVFLWGGVEDIRGRCTLVEEENLVVFELPKVDLIDWPSLETDVRSLGRSEKHAIRTRAVELSQKRAADEIAAGLARREANKEMTIREQIRLDEESRERIAAVRSFHSGRAMDEFSQWKAEADVSRDSKMDPSIPGCKTKVEECNIGDLNSGSPRGAGNPSSESGTNTSRGSKQKTRDSDSSIWSQKEIKGRGDASIQVPGIRKETTITVAFTPREFPTPSRESTAVEEEQWLKKQAEVRKTCGFNDEDLRPEERDPQWLYEKGETLMERGSYIGAVSAFSTGIKMAPKMGELFAGRAKAHLALQNVRKAVEDATQGLEELMPRVPQNAQARLKCHQVRGEAFHKLNMNQDALTDLRAALRLDAEKAELKSLLEVVTKAADEEYFRDSSEEEGN